MLGIAAKAGAVASGETAAEHAVRSGKASLVIISEDASDNTRKKFTNLCRYREVPFVVFGAKAALGRAAGKGERSSLAVTDPSLAEALLSRMHDHPADGSRSQS